MTRKKIYAFSVFFVLLFAVTMFIRHDGGKTFQKIIGDLSKLSHRDGKVRLGMMIPLNTPPLSNEPVTYSTHDSKVVRWKQLPVTICINNDIPPDFRQPVLEAIKVWNQAFEKPIFQSDCVTKLKIKDISDMSKHSFFWVTEKFETFTDKTKLARAVYAFDEDTGEMMDADILINAQYYDWHQIKADLTTLMVHELGHVLGLKHDFISLGATMNYYPYANGYIMRQIGPHEKAIVATAYFDKQLDLPEYVASNLRGEDEAAITNLEKRIPHLTANEWYALGYLYKGKKKYAESIDAFQRSLAENGIQDKDNVLVLYQIGDAYWNLNDDKKATEYFQQCLEKDPNHYESAANLGVIFFQNGEKEKTIQFLRRALEIQPAHYVACMYLHKVTGEKHYLDCVTKYGPPTENKK